MTDLRLGRWQDVLRDIPDASVRLILTSPPYDDAREYEGTAEPVDFGELAAFALRVLMPGGTLAMVLDGTVNDGEASATPYRVICEWAALEGWKLRQVLAYGRHGAPGEYRGRFRRDHEPLLIFVRDGPSHVCVKDRIVERATSRASPGCGYASRQRDGKMRPKTSTDPSATERKHRGSIWWHPATFAEAFARDAVTIWSNPGDLVVDPFAGSATVGRACIDLGRHFIGAERVAKYHAIGMRRLAQTTLPIEQVSHAHP